MVADGEQVPHRSEWLTGPSLPAGAWPGQRLGLPESGPGASAPMLKRVGGIVIDWLLALGIANLFITADPVMMNVAIHVTFAIIYLVSVWFLGRTPGHLLMGIGVVDVATRRTLASTGPVGGLRALLRTVLVCLVLPVVVTDPDTRGLHDKASGTVVVRTR